MTAFHSVLLGLGLLLPLEAGHGPAAPPDCAAWREMLQDRQHPRGQSQAALLLLQNHAPEAEEIVRQTLQQIEATENFLALTAALRLCPDRRFNKELVDALVRGRPVVRQSAAEALAWLADEKVIRRLRTLAENRQEALDVRQAAVWTLGRSGRKQAAAALLDLLPGTEDALRPAVLEALTDLTGLACGNDVAAWQGWWARHKDLSNERWLQDRLVYQTSHARHLEGELERARAQLVRLQQQYYERLPLADRLGQVRAVAEHEDGTLRALAVIWSVELLPTADAVGQRTLADVLLRLSGDGMGEVQRPAVLALGHVMEARAFERLQWLLQHGSPAVRAAAARALTQQAVHAWQEQARQAAGERGHAPSIPDASRAGNAAGAPFTLTRAQVIPALQRALDDPSLEVVIEVAEDLGTLGVPEAGPVLTALLRHPSEPVRQTAAQALERVADRTVLDGLVTALDDPLAAVRFSLVGALGHAVSDGHGLGDARRSQLVERLENLVVRDPDAGVRSRAATVLGECGPPEVLPILWQRVLAAEDGRVQDKAWAAVIHLIIRAGNPVVLGDWDRKLVEAKQGGRRLQLLEAVHAAWQKSSPGGGLANVALDALVQAQLEQGKWAAALPLVRDILARPCRDNELDKRLHWLLVGGQQALQGGDRAECQRVLRDAQPFLARSSLGGEFEKLEKQVKTGP